MKIKSLIASVALALVAVSAANAQIYVRGAVGFRPGYGRVVYAYNYPVAPVTVVAATPVTPVVTSAPAVVYANPAPAVVYAPAPAVVVAPRAYWGFGYGWGPRFYGRGWG